LRRWGTSRRWRSSRSCSGRRPRRRSHRPRRQNDWR
jgi:hypothetical protein